MLRLSCLTLLLTGCLSYTVAVRGEKRSAGPMEDLVILTSGERLQGRILQQNANELVFAQRWGTFNIPLTNVQTISRNAVAQESVEKNQNQRLPTFTTLIQATNARWQTQVQQIPATV